MQACAEYLVSEGFTSPSSMGAHVNSAGGLLGGVMANVRPGLFSAMVMKVCTCASCGGRLEGKGRTIAPAIARPAKAERGVESSPTTYANGIR